MEITLATAWQFDPHKRMCSEVLACSSPLDVLSCDERDWIKGLKLSRVIAEKKVAQAEETKAKQFLPWQVNWNVYSQFEAFDNAAFEKEVDDFFDNNKSTLVNHTNDFNHDKDYEKITSAAYSTLLSLPTEKSLTSEEPAEVKGRATHVAKIPDVCIDDSSAGGTKITSPSQIEILSEGEVAFGPLRKISNEYMSDDEYKIATTFNAEAPYDLDELATSSAGLMPSVKSPDSVFGTSHRKFFEAAIFNEEKNGMLPIALNGDDDNDVYETAELIETLYQGDCDPYFEENLDDFPENSVDNYNKWAKEWAKFGVPAKTAKLHIDTRLVSKLMKNTHLFIDSPDRSVAVQPQFLWNHQAHAKLFTQATNFMGFCSSQPSVQRKTPKSTHVASSYSSHAKSFIKMNPKFRMLRSCNSPTSEYEFSISGDAKRSNENGSSFGRASSHQGMEATGNRHPMTRMASSSTTPSPAPKGIHMLHKRTPSLSKFDGELNTNYGGMTEKRILMRDTLDYCTGSPVKKQKIV